MLDNKSIGVVVPCYNVSHLIGKVIENMPGFVDYMVCVDDHSDDNTYETIEHYAQHDARVILIAHPENQGVGGAIGSGYLWTRERNIDISVVMAGDAQMDPKDLEKIVKPVLEGKADYVKGNRFYDPAVLTKMPRIRLIGSIILSFLTKIASGYWHIADSQCGYTAMALHVLKTIEPKDIYKRYGMPNDLLVTLNIQDFSVVDVPVNAVYGVGEKSGIRVRIVIFTIAWLMIKLFTKRMIYKYVYKSFHPLVLLYFYGFPAFIIGVFSGITITIIDIFFPWIFVGYGWMLLVAMIAISGYFSIVAAMFMDMQYNRHLDINRKHCPRCGL
ncbi:glycosyltransferase family 2 protein [Deltaproteobacteria bacterium TL4]